MKRNRIQTILVLVALLAVFYLVHVDLLITGMVRLAHDNYASYANFYYTLNCIANGTLPLWDPFTHAGQPYYYQFTKMPGGEFIVFLFGLIAYLFNPSFLKLHSHYNTFSFLIFSFGAYYFARQVFSRKEVPYYVLIVSLFSSQYGILMGSESPILTITFVPWLMAFFVLFVTGRMKPHHLIASAVTFILYAQTTESIVSFYFLVLFIISYLYIFKSQTAVSRIKGMYWGIAALLLCAGLVKLIVLFGEKGDVIPSLRYLTGTGNVGADMNIASPSDQVAMASGYDYLNLLNPVIDLDPVGNGCEFQLYLGIIPLFLFFYAVASARSRLMAALAVPAVFSFLLTFGPDLFLSRLCFYVLPLFKSIRVMENFAHAPVFISLVFISALGLEKMLNRIDTEDMSTFWSHTKRDVWIFVASSAAIATAYVLMKKEYSSSLVGELLLLSYSYSVIPVLAVALFVLHRYLQKGGPARFAAVMASGCFLALGVVVVLGAFSKVPAFAGMLYGTLRQALFGSYYSVMQQYLGGVIIIAFIFMLAGLLLLSLATPSFQSRRNSFVVVTILCCLTIMDLLRTAALHPYTQYDLKTFEVPETRSDFTYKPMRAESFWPPHIQPVYIKPPIHEEIRPYDTIAVYFRPAMLYLESSIITKPLEYDYYMLKHFWDAFSLFPEPAKGITMGIDAPKLAFFGDYKESTDADTIREIRHIDPQVLKSGLYLAPDRESPRRDSFSGSGKFTAFAQVLHFDNNSLVLSVFNDREGFLYYSDGYSKGWKCVIDERQQPVRRANIAFKAVFLPSGTHTIRFSYRPTLYLISLFLFLGSCLIGIGCAFALYIQDRRGRRKQFT